MAHRLNYGKRFSGYRLGSLRAQGSPKVPSHAALYAWWWTPVRDSKLEYIMEKYDDLEKAARVLAIPLYCVALRLRHLRIETRKAVAKRRKEEASHGA